MMVFESYVCVFRLKLYHNGQEELRVFIGSADSCIFVWFLYGNIFDTLAYKYEYYFYRKEIWKIYCKNRHKELWDNGHSKIEYFINKQSISFCPLFLRDGDLCIPRWLL